MLLIIKVNLFINVIVIVIDAIVFIILHLSFYCGNPYFIQYLIENIRNLKINKTKNKTRLCVNIEHLST